MIFTFDDGFNSKLLKPDNGAFDGNVWNGNSNRVIITATGTCRIQSVTVVYGLPCQHEWSYVSNNDGTHTGTCSLCGETVTEDCTYNEEHKCSVCGYAEPTRTVTVNFDETNESSTFGNYQWVNENGDVVEAPAMFMREQFCISKYRSTTTQLTQ